MTGVLVDSRMTFVDHIESIVSKSARILRFIKGRECNDPYRTRRCMWLLSGRVESVIIERIQYNFIRFAFQVLGWTTQPLPSNESRCLLLGLEILSDRREIAAALVTFC
jgi:hypothetical protein